MASSEFLSKRVKKKSQTGLTTDRYEFLGLDKAEPDLGDPLVGLSSVGANPPPISGNQYVLTAYENQTGRRYWTAAAQITGSGLIPGSFTVFNNNIQVGAANSFNKFNFVGTGVTVDFVGVAATEQTGIATVRITVTDLTGQGNVNSIPFKESSGLLEGASDFVYSSGNIGIGSTQPTVKLDVIGNAKVLGIVTATTFVGSFDGLASTSTTALGFSTTASINTSGIITSTWGFVGDLTGTATTSNNVSSTININTSGIITATTFFGTLVGTVSSIGQSFNTISVAGISTLTNGPILVGSGIQTGTSELQVTGDTFITGSVGIGTTIPTSKLSVSGDGNFTGVVTATSFFGSGSNLTGLLSNTVSTSSTTVPQYIGFLTTTSGTISSNFVSSTLTYIPSSGNLGIVTTNPKTTLQVETYGVKTGVGTFTASVGVSTTIDSFSVSSTDFKTAEYTIHIGFGSYIQAQKGSLDARQNYCLLARIWSCV